MTTQWRRGGSDGAATSLLMRRSCAPLGDERRLFRRGHNLLLVDHCNARRRNPEFVEIAQALLESGTDLDAPTPLGGRSSTAQARR
jgi:hypothetical protein